MPFYDYRCSQCDYLFEEFLKIADVDSPLSKPCPNCSNSKIEKVISSPSIGDPVRLGVTRAPADFQKYVLGRIKERHPTANGIERTRSITKEI
jgi:putative FmdB family regulatory protein